MTRLRDLIAKQPKRGLDFPAWLEQLASVGIVTTNQEVARRQRFTNIGAYAIAANAASHLIINSAYAGGRLTIVHVYNLIVTLAALLVHRLHRFGDNVAALTLVSIVIAGNLLVVWMMGRQSNLQVYFTLAGAMLFMVGIENWRLFLVWFAFAVAALIASIELAPEHGLLMVEDDKLRQVLSGHALINTIVINALMIYYALTALRQAEIELEHQYARSEALVTAVMPASIAARLKAGTERRIADRIENLSVLFADLVGFTTASHDLPPEQVVDYLDGLVRSFDALCEACGVEKIKSAGDSYMAIAGLDGDSRRGAVAIGDLALAMLATHARRPPLGGQRLALRIGIHCGPATAGVIGDSRLSYDVWGAAVNVASRMESHGVPDRIQVSEDFRALAAGSFAFEERGATDIKGIGSARTFFLLDQA
jgi:adenylate cyclase